MSYLRRFFSSLQLQRDRLTARLMQCGAVFDRLQTYSLASRVGLAFGLRYVERVNLVVSGQELLYGPAAKGGVFRLRGLIG